ncbi:hypothetical protein EV426DRAFT_700912 [Tirmania nivea]|nr:hypothetical protein EV426DRAFT_700912 [Tirmania nivea]
MYESELEDMRAMGRRDNVDRFLPGVVLLSIPSRAGRHLLRSRIICLPCLASPISPMGSKSIYPRWVLVVTILPSPAPPPTPPPTPPLSRHLEDTTTSDTVFYLTPLPPDMSAASSMWNLEGKRNWHAGDLLLWEINKRIEVEEGYAVFFRSNYLTHNVFNITASEGGGSGRNVVDLFSHINLKRVDQARGRHGRKIPKGQEAIRTFGDEEEEARRCERLGRNTTLSR